MKNAKIRHYQLSEEKNLIEVKARIETVKSKAEIDILNKKLSRKQHTDAEMKMIADAYNDLKVEHANEIREVLIKSEYVSIGKLIGKGWNETVHLGTYMG